MARPFRADNIGSLLRPPELIEARTAHRENRIASAELRKIEDQSILMALELQKSAGVDVFTDGEYRRAWWHFDFLEGLGGVEGYEADQGIQFAGVQTKARGVKVTSKLHFKDHPFVDAFKFVKDHTRVAAKMTIPAPSVLHFRGGRKGISKTVYPELDAFFDDLARTYKDAVAAFYKAGCRYLQFDDTVWAYLCSQKELALARQRGDDPTRLPEIYARVINEAIKDRPSDMVITTHVCRGNFRSTWISEGGYEPVAETLFGKVNYDGYFLEYDTERAGGFEPLRFVPKGNKQIVLGLVTSKSGTLEKKEDIKARIKEAEKFVALDQLCLSPQCGFASTEEGNVLTEEAQWAKMKMIVDLSREVWG